MVETVTTQAIVVGGGPAGVIASMTLAKHGINTILLDKKPRHLIGDKNCGDALDKEVPKFLQEKLGIQPPHGDEVSDIVKTLTIEGRNEDMRLNFVAPGYTVNRLIYGQRLLKDAESFGVEIHDQIQVIHGLLEDNKVVGVLARDKNGKEIHYRAQMTIDASGFISVVRRSLPPDFVPALDKSFNKDYMVSTYREIIELTNGDHDLHNTILLKYEPDIPSPGYIWFFTKGPRKLNVGTGFVKKGENAKLSMKKVFKTAFKKYYQPDEYKIIDAGGGQVPIRPPFDTMVAPGFMVAGDAAAQVDPTTAEGHGPALTAGYYAGLVAAQAIENNDVSINALWPYNVTIMKGLGVKHALSMILAQVLEDVGVDGLEFILKRRLITNDDIIKAYENPNYSLTTLQLLGRVLKMFPRYGLVWQLKRLFDKGKQLRQVYMAYPETPDNLTQWQQHRNKILPL